MIKNNACGADLKPLIKVPAQPAVFTSEAYFKEAGITVMWDNFREQFLGRFVSAEESEQFSFREVEQVLLDSDIIANFGGKIEVSISQFKFLLETFKKLSANGENSDWLVFYLRGKDRKLWSIDVIWNLQYMGWDVEAEPTG
ncbi:MAG: hypothetical protein COX06_01445 [Candidatus Zambryskibacteria bacterium CG22_combo_CG10-13_8_21_14_all_42_17]|uniref:Uncharacterized protein n=1 Tax=Candidatus Zambryskibacteria bacterium CG22_combo_CG10-13_8_21_14_all_42_17 TaxID=1975118 RepID=A0A2H0BDK4_9BACT|nr:MAG: hypothetical protein COX06_01445 [Candidatus Zambryskibacteria bacterium CG22_combo_CG10-13_8_21_14_all_42_17]